MSPTWIPNACDGQPTQSCSTCQFIPNVPVPQCHATVLEVLQERRPWPSSHASNAPESLTKSHDHDLFVVRSSGVNQADSPRWTSDRYGADAPKNEEVASTCALPLPSSHQGMAAVPRHRSPSLVASGREPAELLRFASGVGMQLDVDQCRPLEGHRRVECPAQVLRVLDEPALAAERFHHLVVARAVD